MLSIFKVDFGRMNSALRGWLVQRILVALNYGSSPNVELEKRVRAYSTAIASLFERRYALDDRSSGLIIWEA